MKTLISLIFSFSFLFAQAQVSSNNTDTSNVAITITPSGFHSKSNGILDTTNVALGTKANASTNPFQSRYNNTMLGIKTLNKNLSGIENLAMGNNVMNLPIHTSYNTIIGVQARSDNSDGDYVTSIGYSTFINSNNITPHENAAYGANAMKKGSGKMGNLIIGANASFDFNGNENSTIVGSNALLSNNSGPGNTIVGSEALYSSTYTEYNSTIGILNFKLGGIVYNSVAIGALALDSVSTSTGLTGVGADALLGLSTGYVNLAIGYKALVGAKKSRNSIGIGAGTLLNSKEGEDNVAIGVESLRSITTSRGNVGIGFNAMSSHNGLGFIGFNTAVGYKAIFNSTNTANLTAVGTMALYSSTTGILNSAFGYKALIANTTGTRNLAFGSKALLNNTTGAFNVAIGAEALINNISGNLNIAVGLGTLHSNIDGFYNIAIGDSALYNYSDPTESFDNVAVGKRSGYTFVSGDNNLFIGSLSGSTGNFTNATAIGANAIVDAGNKIRFGDTNVTVIEGQVPFSNVSDKRFKENIVYTSRLGLDFIMGLQSASYQYKTDKTHTRYDGFFAQDIEKLMQDLKLPFSGLKKSDNGTYSLAYSDFIIPLVNARKEQQAKLADLKKEILEEQKVLELLIRKLGLTEDLKATINQSKMSFK